MFPAGTRLGRYTVEEFLGAGGMGAVYRARDEVLQRRVALKVLPPELTTHTDRLTRFTQEARAASSLNHPNIVTIFDFGQAEVPSLEGNATVHFLTMELIDGETLRSAFRREDYTLTRRLAHLRDVAEGLAKAHAAGIVHRDLKPENIMITRDGHAKILDFGLAKLLDSVPREQDNFSRSPTQPFLTAPGRPVGTPGYSAPEQIEGREVDHRADVFSLGCVLYEAAAGKPPFTGRSSIEVMHKILSEDPPIAAEMPGPIQGELQRIVGRCLAKDPEDRYQSIKDLAVELRQLGGISSAPKAGAISRPRASRALFVAVSLGVAIVMLAAGGLLIRSRQSNAKNVATSPATAPSLDVLPIERPIVDAAVSPDGKYVVYATRERDKGKDHLRIRHIESHSETAITVPTEQILSGVTFSPDGSRIYYAVANAPVRPTKISMYEIPVLGGTSKLVEHDVWSTPRFAPDARRFAFVRLDPGELSSKLVIRSADSSEERVIHEVRPPQYSVSSAWSPDGRVIALLVCTIGDADYCEVLAVEPDSTKSRSLIPMRWRYVADLIWLSNDVLAVTGSPSGSQSLYQTQVHLVDVPSGRIRTITNDQDRYDHLSAAPDKLGVTRAHRQEALWRYTFDRGGSAARMTFAPGNFHGLCQAADGQVIYSAEANGERRLFIMNVDGSDPRRLTDGAGDSYPACSPDGKVVAFQSNRGGRRNLWRLDLASGAVKQLTDGTENAPVWSQDGRWIYYVDVQRVEIGRVSPDGGPTEIISDSKCGLHDVSPDGRHLAAWCLKGGLGLAVVESEGGRLTRKIDLPTGRSPGYSAPRWSPDGKRILYLSVEKEVSNVWQVNLSNGKHAPVTNFAEGEIYDFAITRDESALLLRRGIVDNNFVVIRNLGVSASVPSALR